MTSDKAKLRGRRKLRSVLLSVWIRTRAWGRMSQYLTIFPMTSGFCFSEKTIIDSFAQRLIPDDTRMRCSPIGLGIALGAIMLRVSYSGWGHSVRPGPRRITR